MKSNKTLKITYGAMLIAVFAMLLLLNRQTGGVLEGILLFVLPIPITAYAVQYGGKASLTVYACMVIISFFFGTFSAIFYAIAAATIGLVQGTRIYHKRDMTHTLFLIMILEMAAELFSMVVLAQLTTGVGLDQDIQEMQDMLDKAFANAGAQLPEGQSITSIFTASYLKRIMLIAIAVTGALEGFITFELSVIILRKLRVPIPKQKPLREFFPPKWTGLVALAAFIEYYITFARPLANDTLQNIAQTVGICGYFYLMIFGVIALAMCLRAWVTRSKVLIVILTVLGMFMLPYLVLFLGIFYLVGSLHQRILDRIDGGHNEIHPVM